ncbi:MAG: phosphoribosylformylglycinamidine synthase subunit PurS [Candidatus Diapherotrites archaeon]
MEREWVHRIEVGVKEGFKDTVAESVKSSIEEDLGIKGIESMAFFDVYYIHMRLTESEAREVAENVLIDPIINSYSLNNESADGFDWAIEVQLHANVTDNLGIVAKQATEELLARKLEGEIRTARKFLLKARISEKETRSICTDLLANEVIESYNVKKLGG